MDSSAGAFKYSPDFYYGAQTTSTAELFTQWLTGTLKRPRGAPSRHCSHCFSTPAFKSLWLLVPTPQSCLFVPVSTSGPSPYFLFAARELGIVDNWALVGWIPMTPSSIAIRPAYVDLDQFNALICHQTRFHLYDYSYILVIFRNTSSSVFHAMCLVNLSCFACGRRTRINITHMLLPLLTIWTSLHKMHSIGES